MSSSILSVSELRTTGSLTTTITMMMLRKALTALALVPIAWGAEEFDVLLEDMVEKVCPLRYA